MKTKNTNPMSVLDQQIASLERRKALLKKLTDQRNEVEQEINSLLKEPNEKPSTRLRGNRHSKHRKLALPRGVITAAAFEVIKKNQKPMPVTEIIDAVKESPFIKGHRVPNLERKVRGIVNTGEHFKHVSRGVYTTKGELDGKLFEHLLQKEVTA